MNPEAKKFDEISYIDVIKKGLNAMDTTAISLCMENKIPVIAFAKTHISSYSHFYPFCFQTRQKVLIFPYFHKP